MNKNGKGKNGPVFAKKGYQHIVRWICKQCSSRLQRVLLSHVGFCEILSPKKGWGVFWTVWKTIMSASDDVGKIESVFFNALLDCWCIKFGAMLIKLERVPSSQTLLRGFPTNRGVYSLSIKNIWTSKGEVRGCLSCKKVTFFESNFPSLYTL